ncbi:MAG: hypothetical protein KAT66_00475 [Candidatus Lokiarchaeota archaeon]|nr:hypothetical protein [Candidatus Lokiarchaeota archaeon]
MKPYIIQIDDAIQNKRRTTYRGNKDYYDFVVAKPIEASGLLKYKIRIIKAMAVLKGKADAFTYEEKF